MHVLRLKGNLGRTRFIFLSEDRRSDVLRGYRRKAERDYDDMVNLQNALDNSKKPRKKIASPTSSWTRTSSTASRCGSTAVNRLSSTQ